VSAPRGFTLIEMLIAVVIAGILIAIGVPAFLSFEKSLRHDSARETLIEDIRRARQIAVTQRHPVIVVFGAPPTTANIRTYTIHVDTNEDGLAQPTEPRELKTLPDGVVLGSVALNPVDSLRFDVTGLLAPGATGGTLILNRANGRDTLLVSATGAVFRP
jgi:prepilin-type N-terminal cleavage/methylation domain-containing protein